jgi:hypothetical protein
VTSEGDLVDAFDLINNFKNAHKARGFNIAVIRSEDHGETWSDASIVTKHFSFQGLVTDPDDPSPNTQRVRTGDIVLDVAAGPNNTVYLVFQDTRFTGVSSIGFTQSTDGGLSWSDPIQVNQTPTNVPTGNQQAFTASVDVSSDGTVGVTYYDFRNNTPATTLPTDYFLIHCHPSGTVDCSDESSWVGSEQQLTNASFDMRQAPFARGWFVGDYEGLASFGDDFLPFWDEGVASPADPSSSFFRRAAGPAIP